jgi:murein endopeptidase
VFVAFPGTRRRGPGRRPAVALSLCLTGLALPAQVYAVPPAAAVASAASQLPAAHWVEHRVLLGERLGEIAERYGVSSAAIVRWNKLDEARPRLRAGENLRVRTSLNVRPREKRLYTVRKGDSWGSIAKKFGVDADDLKVHWNPKLRPYLKAGQQMVVWTEAQLEPEPGDLAGPVPEGSALLPAEAQGPMPALVPVPPSAQSVGSPDRGRLANAMQLPVNTELYAIRNPAQSWASSHTIVSLQQAIAEFRRRTRFPRELVICDISTKSGGRFRPHRSHRSGRDVDLRLPLAQAVREGTVPNHTDQVDWDATWQLVRALVDGGQVRFIFLSTSRQRLLRAAALRAGATPEQLDTLIQYPRQARTAVVRHARGHDEHMHIRFVCGPNESSCIE